MGSKRQKRNKKAAENAADARQSQKKVWGARLTIGVVLVAVAAAYLREDEVDISRITESRHCPRDKIKEFRHVPTFAVPPSCPYVVRSFVKDGDWLGTKFLNRLQNAHGPPQIEYDELSRGTMFTYYDKNMKGQLPASSSYSKRIASSPRQLLSNIKKSRAARFGGPLRQISPYLESEMINTRWAEEARTTWDVRDSPRPTGLWVGGKNTSSASHFDLFANFHVLLSGRKRVSLAPPIDHFRFKFWPAPHPHARQARVEASFETPAITLKEGDAVYVPSGWVHKVVAERVAAAASFTALPPEFQAFEGLVREQVGAMFVDRGWSQVRAIGIIRVYLPAVAKFWLGEDIAQSVLSNYADSYDKVAKEVPPLAKCPVPPDRDIRIALRYANATASAFSWFRADLAALFFGPFADTVVQRVPHPALKGAQRWGAAAAFVRECCLFNDANRGFSLRAVLNRPAVLGVDDEDEDEEDE